ncbi:MAG: hypothetical protein PHD76_08320 [Methylacidiphilales bacterium]|nr:hypothetical protein [Candidatus Methylacidiphilales bacterium]
MNPIPPETAPANTITPEQAEYLQSLRRGMTGYLAVHIPFPLFQAGRRTELQARIQQLVDSKLAEQETELAPHLHDKLILDILTGMPSQTATLPGMAVSENVVHTVETLRALIVPYMARHISNDLLQEGHEKTLAKKIIQLVDEKLAADSIRIDAAMRHSLIEVICRNANVPVPEIIDPTPPMSIPATPAKPEAVAKPPAAHQPATALKPHLAPTKPTTQPGNSEKKATKIIPRTTHIRTGLIQPPAPALKPDAESDEILFTDDLKRELLLAIGQGLDAKIMGSGDEAAVRKHISNLIESYCAKHNLDLEDEIENVLFQAILSGEGVEFQL